MFKVDEHCLSLVEDKLMDCTLLIMSMKSKQVHRERDGFLVYCSWYDTMIALAERIFRGCNQRLSSTMEPPTHATLWLVHSFKDSSKEGCPGGPPEDCKTGRGK